MFGAGGSDYLRQGKGHTTTTTTMMMMVVVPHNTGTMQSSRLLSGALLCALLLLSGVAGAQVLDTESEEELSPRALRDFYPKGPNLTSEKQLVRLISELICLFCMRKKDDATLFSQKVLLFYKI